MYSGYVTGSPVFLTHLTWEAYESKDSRKFLAPFTAMAGGMTAFPET